MLTNKILLAAYIKGHILNNNLDFNRIILDKNVYELSDKEIDELIKYAESIELKTYYFKEKEILPRIKVVLGTLKGIYPQTLLDVGSGRGQFIFPLLNEFPNINVTCIDILDKRINMYKNLKLGGIDNINYAKIDITKYTSSTIKYDCVTMLEVLEHIPNVKEAIKNAIELTNRFIIITVPNKPDNNPEHIHLLTKDILTEIFHTFNVTKLNFSGVGGHLVLIAQK